MSTKTSRAGGKYNGNHTTMISAAIKICKQIERLDLVTKIGPGFIKAGLKSVSGKKRVKVVIETGCILLTVRDVNTCQHIRVYSADLPSLKQKIAKIVESVGFELTPDKNCEE